jgi:hypothetical protein
MTRKWFVAALAAISWLGVAGQAQATTLALRAADGDIPQHLEFTDSTNVQETDLFVQDGSTDTQPGILFKDGVSNGKPITIDASAASICAVDFAPNAVVCEVTNVLVVVDGGDGQDRIDVVDAPIAAAILLGGTGNDKIFGGANPDIIDGEAGDDALIGEAGDDVIEGGEGDDVIGAATQLGDVSESYHPGADTMTGGPGFDTVAYANRFIGVAGSVKVTFDATANDGRPDEKDDVGDDVEAVQGTNQADTLIADDQPRALHGNGGADTITGGPMADTLTGGDGIDVIDGAAGDDSIDGKGDADKLTGGAGKDTLLGDGGCSQGLNCFDGNDQFNVRDGEADSVTCQGGADTVVGDKIDVLDFTCESTDLAGGDAGGGGSTGGGGTTTGGGGTTTTTTGGGGGTTTPAAPTLSAPAKVKATRLGRGIKIVVKGSTLASLKATLSAPAKLLRRLRLKAPIGSASGLLGSAGSTTLTVKLSRKARRAARKLKGATLTLKVVLTDEKGARTTLTARVKVT